MKRKGVCVCVCVCVCWGGGGEGWGGGKGGEERRDGREWGKEERKTSYLCVYKF